MDKPSIQQGDDINGYHWKWILKLTEDYCRY